MQRVVLYLLVLSVFLGRSQNASVAKGGFERVEAFKQEIALAGHCSPGTLRLFELQPFENEPTALPLKVWEAMDQFEIRIPRFDRERDRIYSGFRLQSKLGAGEWRNLGAIHFVIPSSEVSRFHFPYPTLGSKKGLQVQMVDDALALGIKHAALNVNLARLIDLKPQADSLKFVSDGIEYFLNQEAVRSQDRQIKALSDQGVAVALILLYYVGNQALDSIMAHPDYSPECPNHLSAFNTSTPDGLRYFKACLEFLADRYSRDDQTFGRAVNYIVGNEVNSHWFWCNMGHKTMRAFADDYLRAARVCHTAIRKSSANSRVFLSLEHHWNIRYAGGDETQCFPARAFLDYFNQQAKAGGDFDWHIAFHPYPENLFNPRTWEDKTATRSEDTPRITFKNIELLPEFLARPDILYRGRPRRIILSEQGFHSADGSEGERMQAAGFVFAWEKVKDLEGIDAFILHRHVDNRGEGGLNLGLWSRKPESVAEPFRKKMIYEMFRQADTPSAEQAFQEVRAVLPVNSR